MENTKNRSDLERLALVENAAIKAHDRIDRFREKFEKSQKELSEDLKNELKNISDILLKIRLGLAERKGKEKMLIAVATIVGGLIATGSTELIRYTLRSNEKNKPSQIQTIDRGDRRPTGRNSQRERLPNNDRPRSSIPGSKAQ